MAVAAAPSRPAEAVPAPRRRPGWVPVAAVLTAYLGLAFALFAPVWAHANAVLIGNQVDSSPHTWFVAWAPFALSHGQNPLSSSWLGAPNGANIAWNTPVFLLGVATWPVSALAGPVVAFNLVMALGPALTAFFTYLALRRYVGSVWAAAAGGLLAGFSPYILAHDAAGHSNQVTAMSAPLLFLLLDSLVVRRRWSPWLLGLLLGLLAAGQVYVTEEMLAGEAVMAVGGLLLLAALAGPTLRQRMVGSGLRRLGVALLAAVPVLLLLTAPLLWTQFFGPQHLTGQVRAANKYVTDLANFVVPTRLQALAPSRAVSLSSGFTGNLGEWAGYVGIPLIVAGLAVTVWQWRRIVVRWAFAMALLAAVLSLGPSLHVAGRVTHIPLPWRVLGHFPLLNSALPARLTLYMFLAVALLVAVGLDALLRRPRPLGVGVAGILAGLTALTLAPALPLASRPTAVPAFFISAAVRAIPPGSTAYILPSVNPEVMLWQVASNWRFRMVGGWYLGPDAHGHVHDGPAPNPLSDTVAAIERTGILPPPDPALLTTYRAQLHNDGVTSIIVTPNEPHADAVAEFFQEVTETPPASDGAGTTYWTGISI